jgi:hypothetical protein
MSMPKRSHVLSATGALLAGVLSASIGEAQPQVSFPEIPWMQKTPVTPPEAQGAMPAGNPQLCDAKNGPFENTFKSGADCARSPIQLCTQGRLSGDLDAQYDFFFTTMTVADPSQPNTFNFTGFSEITFPSGDKITSNDSGIIRLEQTGSSTFQTNVVFASGTGADTGATGSLTAIGQVDSTTGQGRGIYTGSLCLPAPAVCSQ